MMNKEDHAIIIEANEALPCLDEINTFLMSLLKSGKYEGQQIQAAIIMRLVASYLALGVTKKDFLYVMETNYKIAWDYFKC